MEMLSAYPQPHPRIALAEDWRMLPLSLLLAHLWVEVRWPPLVAIPGLGRWAEVGGWR